MVDCKSDASPDVGKGLSLSRSTGTPKRLTFPLEARSEKRGVHWVRKAIMHPADAARPPLDAARYRFLCLRRPSEVMGGGGDLLGRGEVVVGLRRRWRRLFGASNAPSRDSEKLVNSLGHPAAGW